MSNRNVLLIHAVNNGDQNTVNTLLNHGVDINTKHGGKSALFYAVEKLLTCFEIDQQLINCGACLESPYHSGLSEGKTPLHILKKGMNEVITEGHQLDTALHHTASTDCEKISEDERKHSVKKSKAITETLLNNGADVNSTDEYGQTVLHIAAGNLCAEVVELLLHYNANVNAKDYHGHTPLRRTVSSFRYICDEKCKEITELLVNNNGYQISQEDKHALFTLASKWGYTVMELLLQYNIYVIANDNYRLKKTPLDMRCMIFSFHKRSDKKRREVAELLILKGADVQAVYNLQETVLHSAAGNLCVEVIKLLLQHNVDINAKDHYGYTPLLRTVYSYREISSEKCKEVAELMLNKGADADITYDNKRTILHLALKWQCYEIVELLLHYNINVNAKDSRGNTPLHYAISACTCEKISIEKFKEISELLLIKGADIEAINNDEDTPLHMASKVGCVELVKLFLQYKGNVNVINSNGETPLHLIITSDLQESFIKEIAEMFVDEGALLKSSAYSGMTPLHLASQKGFVDVVKLLLQHDADIHCADNYRSQPIHQAAQNGHESVVKLLIEYGADVNSKKAYGETALHSAVSWNKIEAVFVLLESGADVNCSDIHGDEPIHHAAQNGNDGIMKLLIKYGADVNSRNAYEKTPLHSAVVRNNIEAVVVLLEYGADINLECYHKQTPFQYILDVANNDGMVHVLTSHVVKLITRNSYVNVNNIRELDSSPTISDFRFECEREIENMKVKIRDTNVTYFDLFVKNMHSLSKYANNENIVYLYESQQFIDSFPIYADTIRNHLHNAIRRRQLVDQCSHILYLLSNKLCSELS